MINNRELTQSQYQQLSKLVYETSGIVLNKKKYRLLVARLSKRMRVTKINDVSDYIKYLTDNPDEFLAFIDATTTNYTFFFRENKHCEYLMSVLGPDKPLRIWSAASSSGEEAYSIAVQLMDRSYSFSIDASDISDSMLEKGRSAIYSMDKVKAVPRGMLHTYFQRGKDQWTDHVRVKSDVRKMVRFFKFNLLSDKVSEQYDIIFCRNVMIYFDRPTRQKIVDRLYQALAPGGYFFVGLAEGLHGLDHKLKSIIPSGYRKD